MSLVYDIGPVERAVGRFMGAVRREVQKAVAIEKETRKLTQQQIANKLGTSKSVINREILGGNLTLRRLAELAWALGWEIDFQFRKPAALQGQNQDPATDLEGAPQTEGTKIFERLIAA